MSLTLSNASAREWLARTREGIKPWGEFINTSKFKTPKSVAPVPKRIMKNIEHFQSNYLFVFLGLVLFCVLTSPMLLIAIAACLGACYIINIKNQEKKLSIMGKELSVSQQYAAVGLCSFPLFWLAGAGSAVFWIIGASFFVIMLHASFYTLAEDGEDIDLVMDEVV
ncbi:prenylated Rab acceptor protein 1-like isoform X3 [Argopecten irradians]